MHRYLLIATLITAIVTSCDSSQVAGTSPAPSQGTDGVMHAVGQVAAHYTHGPLNTRLLTAGAALERVRSQLPPISGQIAGIVSNADRPSTSGFLYVIVFRRLSDAVEYRTTVAHWADQHNAAITDATLAGRAVAQGGFWGFFGNVVTIYNASATPVPRAPAADNLGGPSAHDYTAWATRADGRLYASPSS
jgi:hypothetical protein